MIKIKKDEKGQVSFMEMCRVIQEISTLIQDGLLNGEKSLRIRITKSLYEYITDYKVGLFFAYYMKECGFKRKGNEDIIVPFRVEYNAKPYEIVVDYAKTTVSSVDLS